MWSKNQQGCKIAPALFCTASQSTWSTHKFGPFIFFPVLKHFVEWTYLSLKKCNFRNLRFPDAGTTGRRCKAHGFVRQKRWIYPQVMAIFQTSNGKTGSAPFFLGGVLLKFPNPLISHKGRLMMLEDFNDLVSSGRTYNSATQRARRGAMICTAGRIRFEECKRDIQQLLLLRVQHNILFSLFFFVCPFFAWGHTANL